MIPFTMQVNACDLQLLYRVAATYHSDGKESLLRLLDTVCNNKTDCSPPREDLVDRSASAIKPFAYVSQPTKREKIKSLYSVITENCDCGRCYSALVRCDKVPWITCLTGEGHVELVNAKHGKYTPSVDCACCVELARGKIRGYIHESEDSLKGTLAIEERKAIESRKQAAFDLRHQRDLQRSADARLLSQAKVHAFSATQSLAKARNAREKERLNDERQDKIDARIDQGRREKQMLEKKIHRLENYCYVKCSFYKGHPNPKREGRTWKCPFYEKGIFKDREDVPCCNEHGVEYRQVHWPNEDSEELQVLKDRREVVVGNLPREW